MFSPATRRRDATRLPVALQGGLSVSPVCLWVRAGCARRRSGYRHWHIGWTFQYRFVWHILFEAIRAIDALQAARTVLQREFCVWTQAEPAARNHFNAYLRIA